MNKYSEDIINKYINGEDIDYDIEELENDFNFMIQVINKTNDKEFYNLCGEAIKTDPLFIKYMINKFNNDIEFICKISDYYFDNSQNEIDEMDIIILICEYSKHRNKRIYEEYNAIREIKYMSKLVELEIVKQEEDIELLIDESGMGFMVIEEYYKNNPMTIKYFAKRFVKEILTEEKDFETLIHNNFKTPEEVEQIGIKKYLIDLINKKDKALASYVIVHITVLNSFLIELKQIIKNWDNYLKRIEKKQYLIMLDEVHKYMKDVDTFGLISEDVVLYIVSKELGIEDKVIEYGEYKEEYFEAYKELLDLLEQTQIIGMDEYIHILKVKKIMLETLKNVIGELPEKTLKIKKFKLLKTKKDTD